MSKCSAKAELGPFSSTSSHHGFCPLAMPMWLGTQSSKQPQCRARAARSVKASKLGPAAELVADARVVDDVVAVRAAARGLRDRRAVHVGHAQRRQIVARPRCACCEAETRRRAAGGRSRPGVRGAAVAHARARARGRTSSSARQAASARPGGRPPPRRRRRCRPASCHGSLHLRRAREW